MNKRAPAGKITIDKAFQLLLRKDEPHVVCEQLNIALRTGRVKLFADGAEVSPGFFASHLLVTTAAAPDGGWTAKMTMLRAVKMPDEWTVSDVDDLLKSGPLRRLPGPATTHDWHSIDGQIALRCHDNSGRLLVPKSQSKLANDVLEWCELKYSRSPTDSAMREAVRLVCAQLQQKK